MSTKHDANANVVQMPARSVKRELIYESAAAGLTDGVVIDPNQLKRFATWMCEWGMFAYQVAEHTNQTPCIRAERAANGGFCDECRERSGLMLAECPYIDMRLADELQIEDVPA